jgi:hypothetical protein
VPGPSQLQPLRPRGCLFEAKDGKGNPIGRAEPPTSGVLAGKGWSSLNAQSDEIFEPVQVEAVPVQELILNGPWHSIHIFSTLDIGLRGNDKTIDVWSNL